ncbi:MAG: phosphatidate cytidylyltransferase, partial [Promethearchaeota archaeon]
AAAMLIATIGDGIASIFGMKFGKHNFPKDSPKTIEGYIAGFIGSFGIAILAIWLFESNMATIKLMIIALGGAIAFLLIDLMNLKVNDNILNPVLCGYTMVLLFLLI